MPMRRSTCSGRFRLGGLNVVAAHAIEVVLDATFVIGGGSQTIDNTTIDLGTSSAGATLSTDLAATQGAVLTLGPNLTVDFISGSIKTAQSAGNAIVNDGTIKTDGPLQVGTIVGYDVTNKGTISIASASAISAHVASSFDNRGTISGQGEFVVTGAAAFTNTGTIGVGSAQIAAGSFDNESTITVATGATATITVNSGSNNGMISVGGRLSLGGTLGGSGAIVINDAGTLELTAGTLSEVVSFASGGVGTLQLDGRHLFTGTLSGLAIGDTIDFAKADVRASIAGNTLTVTFADNSTENITLAGPLPAGDFLQTARAKLIRGFPNRRWALKGIFSNRVTE
jgi:fibronectin-binding autotransporter adhesin